MEIIRSREYYDQLNELMEADRKAMDYHIDQALNYKKIYILTTNRHGMYRLLNKWAAKMNQIHCQKGRKLAEEGMKQCLVELVWLSNYINNQQEP